jgi:hypothetical protein
MSKLGCLFGILLIVIGFAALFAFTIIAPEVRAQNESVATLQNALFCNPGEKYVEVLGGRVTDSFGRNAGRAFSAYCEDSEGQQRDATGRSVAIMAGAFAVPFLLGLSLALGSLIAMFRRGSKPAATNAFPTTILATQSGEGFSQVSVVTVTGHQVDSLPPEAAEVIRQVLGGFQASASQFAMSGDLASRLRQLQEARDANLIYEDEYNRLRQQILDAMED